MHDLLKNRHSRDSANDDIVITIKKNRGRQSQGDVCDLAVLLDILPERAVLIPLLALSRYNAALEF